MVTVDRLIIISTILFSLSALLVLISISRTRWILSVNQGETSVGLIEICITSTKQICFIPHQIRSLWIISFILSITAIALLILTVLLFLASHYIQRSTIEYGRFTGFIAMTFLCLSTILFPMGFDSEIIGGSPFQLPMDYRIGSSYKTFVGATWLTVISAIISGHICSPTFVT